MDMRNEFLLQLLQKLGAPLMKAVEKHSAGNQQADANVLASLLSECVKISISLSQAMNLKTEDGDANAIRVSLATLAADLVVNFTPIKAARWVMWIQKKPPICCSLLLPLQTTSPLRQNMPKG